MQAIYLTKYGPSDTAFQFRETDIPIPVKDQVVIKVEASGLNFADVVARRGLYPDAPKNPAVLGYDVAGYVHAIGPDVEGVKVGDRVTALTRFGGYAEYALTVSHGVAQIPDTLDFAEATTLATQACTAYYCAEEAVTLRNGDHVLVQAAAGGVGIMLTQIAKYKGCKIYGTCSTHKLDFIKANGVDVPIDYTRSSFFDVIKEDAGKRGVDVIFDSLGGSAFSQGMKLLSYGGKMVNFGAAQQIQGNKSGKLKSLGVVWNFGLYSPLPLLMKSQAMIGVNMLRISDYKPQVFKEVLDAVIDLYQQGVLRPVISNIYPAEAIAEAHHHLESRESIGKVVLTWS